MTFLIFSRKIMNDVFFVLLLIVLLLFSSCYKSAPPPRLVINQIGVDQKELFLKSWEIVVPIKVNRQIEEKCLPIDKDYLNQHWGHHETTISPNEFRSLGSRWREDSLPSKPVNVIYHSPVDYISLTDVFHVSKKIGYPQFDGVAYYAMCEIMSTVEQDVAVLTDGDDNVKLWVNGQQVYRKTDNTPNFRNNGVNAVHLRKGFNQFLVKTFNLGGGTSFYVSVSNINYAKEIYLNKKNGDFLKNTLLKSTDPLVIALNKLFFKGNDSLKIVVKDVINKTVFSEKTSFNKDTIRIPVSLPNHKAYKVSLYTNEDSISQLLYIGDTASFVRQIKNSFSKLDKKMLQSNINPILIRYDYLNSFAKENGYDFSIEKKIVYCLYEMEKMSARISRHSEPLKDQPGLHMLSYISKIDGKPQYYMLYVPESYNANRPIPMVIEMPWIADVHRHFLKGWRVADFKRVNMIIRQANIYGYAFLWSCSRTYNEANVSPLATAAAQEEIQAVKKIYKIDSTRLYLFGSCLGGGNAMLCASRNPNQFAAVGVEGPALDIVPLEPIENFRTLPIYIAHSDADEKANFQTSYELAQSIKRLGGDVTFVNLKQLRRDYDVNFYPEEIVLRKIFSFFYDKRRRFKPDTLLYTATQNKYAHTHDWLQINEVLTGKTSNVSATIKGNNIKINQRNVKAYAINIPALNINHSQKLRIYENNRLVYDALPNNRMLQLGNKNFASEKNLNTEGPINDLFADGFVVVAGTIGNVSENESMASYSTAFSTAWQKAFNDNCPITTDKQLKESELRNKNLVLVGTTVTNSVLKKLAQKLPFKVDAQSIRIGMNKYSGGGLIGCFIYPNPFNKKRYILVITSNELATLQTFAMVPWYEGLKDYYIYQNGGEVASGFFGQDWK